MNNKLVAYFSATGKTAKVAEKLAAGIGADIYEIKPEVKYTKADLNWMNKKSRSSVEMNNKSIRPAIITGDVDVSGYDTIFLGFPIWWYVAPTVINTFLEAYDFTGKKIVLFATSGSSGFGNTVAELYPSAPGAKIVEAKVLSGIITEAKISALIDVCNEERSLIIITNRELSGWINAAEDTHLMQTLVDRITANSQIIRL